MNRLVNETSPYLRQHRENPVDWYPWGDEALAAARTLDRPLFVSIGYSACHWCHVMAHESFEDEETAQLLNDRFVAVKVDREERPDVDAIYMEAVQATTGSGGWPLSVFATPDGRPFFGGTYFPKHSRQGFPSFTTVLDAVADAWAERRTDLLAQADELTSSVARRIEAPLSSTNLPRATALVATATARFSEIFDPLHGGVGTAPKFPQAPMLELLLRAHLDGVPGCLEMVEVTLDAMASGGIYDHLGGGFARYCVDRAWLVPHFEKMLYDQAALGRLYLHAYQVTGEERWRRVAEETIAYVLRDLGLERGALASSEDADAAGEEGRFVTWTPAEVRAVLGAEEGEAACAEFGITEHGHLDDGRSVPHRQRGAIVGDEEQSARWRSALFAARSERVRPGRDDKALTEWNAMFCSFLAEAAFVFDDDALQARAIALGEFLLVDARREDGRWLRSWQAGRAMHLAVASDYAWLVDCFTRLGECTGAARFTLAALDAADDLIGLFSAEDGGWYSTGSDADALVVRGRDAYDGVIPSASSVAAVALSRLGALSGDERLTARAEATLRALSSALVASPLALSQLCWAAKLAESGPIEVVLVGEAGELRGALRTSLFPDVVVAWGEPAGGPLWEGRTGDVGRGRAYVCERGVCHAPSFDVSAFLDAIEHVTQRRSTA